MTIIVTNQEEFDARGWSNVTALEPVANVLAAARERATALANTEGAPPITSEAPTRDEQEGD